MIRKKSASDGGKKTNKSPSTIDNVPQTGLSGCQATSKPSSGAKGALSPIQAEVKQSLRDIINQKKAMCQAGQHFEEEFIFDPYQKADSCLGKIRQGTMIAYSNELLTHYCLWDEKYPEGPHRLAAIIKKLTEYNLIARMFVLDVPLRDDLYEKITTVHTPQLFNCLKQLSMNNSDADLEKEASKYDSIYFNRHTFSCCLLCVSSCLTLVTQVMLGYMQNGIAVVRPPGHHAMENEFCGYCYFNNVAICAEMLLSERWANRVLIVDVDVHHGQGTQRAFYNRKDVLYFSIHRYEFGTFWPNLRESDYDYIGEGAGEGYNVNVPLNETGCDDSDYMAIILNILLPLAYEYNPDIILVSGGYDAAIGDPEGLMNVTPAFYGHLVTLLSGLANGKVVVLLEGGYFTPSLAEGVVSTVRGLLNDPCPPILVDSVKPSVMTVINNLQTVLVKHWKCFTPTQKPEELQVVSQQQPDEENPKTQQNPKEDSPKKQAPIKYLGRPEKPPFLTRNCYPTKSLQDVSKHLVEIRRLVADYANYPPGPVNFVFDDRMLKHQPRAGTHERPERPERLIEIREMFASSGLDQRCIETVVTERSYAEYNVHDAKYYSSIGSLLVEKPDLYLNEHTKESVDVAVSSVLCLVDKIMQKEAVSGVAIIRPPGHHAERDHGGGFCLVNNAGIAANYMITKYKIGKVLIIDFDIHHGNGTQSLFEENEMVMYISVHRFDHGAFYPNNPEANYDNVGFGIGEGRTMNIPFNDGAMGDSEYMSAFLNCVLPSAYAYGPEIVIVSAGFDAGINDPLGGYHVTPECFGHMMNLLKPLAGGRVVMLLEGGYNLATTSYSFCMATKALLGESIPRLDGLFEKIQPSAGTSIRNVLAYNRHYWPILQVHGSLPEPNRKNIKKNRNDDDMAHMVGLKRGMGNMKL